MEKLCCALPIEIFTKTSMAGQDNGILRMKTSLLTLAAITLLAGCAARPQDPAAAALRAACTKAADAAYKNSTINLQARPTQNGLRFGAPVLAFQGEEMGAMNARALQIQRCEETGLQNGTPTMNGVQIVTPHIVN